MTTKQQTHLKANRVKNASAVGRAANLFLLDCDARNLTPGTLRFYRQRLGAFVAYCEQAGACELDQVTASLIREYLAGFIERKASPYYTHQHARTVKAWCNFLVREGLLLTSPMAAVRLPKLPKDVLPPFSSKDVRALLAACDNERDHALVLTLLDSGVRASELLALNVGDLDTATGALQVRQGKGRKDRTVFIGARTRRVLARYLASRGGARPEEPLFVTLTAGGRIAFFGLQSILRRLGNAAGVHPMGAHRFRRTFAIESLRAGMPLPQLAALMGHEGLAVLQRYLRLVDDDLRAAHDAHGAVDRLLR
jgi:integrase/recombinase XerD